MGKDDMTWSRDMSAPDTKSTDVAGLADAGPAAPMRRSSPAPAAGPSALRRRSVGIILLGGHGLGPVMISLVVIAVIFEILNRDFLTAGNLTNLMLQVSGTGTIAIGVVLILLIGEIDLSVGALSGAGGALLGALYTEHQLNAALAIGIVLVAALIWGTLAGNIVSAFRLPSFVVTLAALLALEGLQLLFLGKTVTISFAYSSGVVKLTSTFFSPVIGAIIAAVLFAVLCAGRISAERRLQRSDGGKFRIRPVLGSLIATAVILTAVMLVFTAYQGLPLVVLLFVGLVVIFDYIVRNTVYGRYLMAVGGNKEAARRAGIPVRRIRVSVFALGSALAAFGGILTASQLLAATGTQGSGDVLIDAIAAAVIGGTSLFGGRGTVYAALLGILIIGGISNGMDLISLSPAVQLAVTGAVLAIAVIADSLIRRARVSPAGQPKAGRTRAVSRP
jgi:D-xylose transport system permease protein